jgi:uncharacterized membrane protein
VFRLRAHRGDGEEALVGLVMVIALIAFVIYVIVMIASAVFAIAATSGAVWGGGTAISNYIQAFKKNMIDSNRAVSVS